MSSVEISAGTEPRQAGVVARLADGKISAAAIHVYFLRLSGAGLGYLVQVVLAQLLGALHYGVFALSWILATVLAQLSTVGFNETCNRFIPGYLIRGDKARARGFVGFSQQLTISVSICAAVLGIGALTAFRDLVPSHYYWPSVMALMCAPLATWTHLLEAVSISRTWMIRGLAPTYIVRPLLLIVIVAAAVLVFNVPATATTAVAGLLVACLVIAVVQRELLRKPLRAELGEGEPSFNRRLWFMSSWPLIMSQGFVILATNIDVLMLGMLTTASDVGVYFAAAKSVAVVSFVSIAVGNAMTRRLAEAKAENKPAAFAVDFQRARQWMLWPSFVLGIGVILGAPILMHLFGPEFERGSLFIGLLMVGVFIHAGAGPIQEALVVIGKQRALAIATVLSMVLNVTLNIILVLSMGVVGAAIASVTATGFRVFLLWLIVPGELISVERSRQKSHRANSPFDGADQDTAGDRAL